MYASSSRMRSPEIFPSHERILLVTGDMTRRRAVTEPLQRAGFEVWCVLGTEAALSLTTLEAPDLLLLDAGTLEASSPATLSRMRALPTMGSVPIFVLLPPDLDPKLAAGLLRGADVCLLSSVDPRILRSRVTLALAKRGQAQRARRRRVVRAGRLPSAPSRQCA